MPKSTRLDRLEDVHPKTRAEWRAWLQRNHLQAESVWIVTYKASSGKPRLTIDDIVEEAIAFGWIDSLPRRVDAERTKLMISPRKPGSAWSAINKARAERMIERGQMTPSGFAKIDAAKQSGGWSKLDAVEALKLPADLQVAFDRHPGAATAFSGFPRSARRGILEWIEQAKQSETRNRRVEETARLAAEGVRANQWRKS
jgi:uncharacterized protein YdeI (YjbR/CyaY-like superfamily)